MKLMGYSQIVKEAKISENFLWLFLTVCQL